MQRVRQGLEWGLSRLRYLSWEQRLRREMLAAQFGAPAGGEQPPVCLFDAEFARRMPALVQVFDDRELNGSSRAAWAVEEGRVVLRGRIESENAEYMAQTPFCGLRVRWPSGLDLSPFHLLRVTGRCNLPLRVTLKPRLLIACNALEAALEFPAGGAHEIPLRLLKDRSSLALSFEEMALFDTLKFTVASAGGGPVRVELERVEAVLDESVVSAAELQRDNSFYPRGYWKDIRQRKQRMEHPWPEPRLRRE